MRTSLSVTSPSVMRARRSKWVMYIDRIGEDKRTETQARRRLSKNDNFRMDLKETCINV